jgi:hypothetical protein
VILRRLPDSRFSTVAPEWRGQAAVVIGGGPSLTLEQVAAVKAARVYCIAVNDAFLWADFADVCYFADASWWSAMTAGTPKPMLRMSAEYVRARFAVFAGERCSMQSQVGNITDDKVHILRNAHVDPNGMGIHAYGLSRDPGALVTGKHGGFQALNIAVLAGATTIILLGIDGQPAKDGRTHWSGGHANEVTPQEMYSVYRQSFSAAERPLKAAGVNVINCSPGSAVDSFPKMTIEDALCLSLTV